MVPEPVSRCSEFPVKRIELVENFDMELISSTVKAMGDTDLGYMSYRVDFADKEFQKAEIGIIRGSPIRRQHCITGRT